MSNYLDQLKQQAEQQKEKEREQQNETLKQQQLLEQTLKPAIKKLHRYLYDLAKQLNYLKPDTRVDYSVEEVDRFDDLLQCDYTVGDYHEDGEKFFLRWACQGRFPFRLARKEEHSAKSLKKFFDKHNIRYDVNVEQENYRFKRALFEVEPCIYTELYFTANPSKNWIDLRITNYEGLGKQHYLINPEQLTNTFLDELAKYITHEPNTLQLTERYQLSTESRQQLKQYTQAKEKEEFDSWLQETQAEMEQLEQQKTKKGLFGRWFS